MKSGSSGLEKGSESSKKEDQARFPSSSSFPFYHLKISSSTQGRLNQEEEIDDMAASPPDYAIQFSGSLVQCEPTTLTWKGNSGDPKIIKAFITGEVRTKTRPFPLSHFPFTKSKEKRANPSFTLSK